MAFHAFKSAMKIGHARTSDVKEPAIWPAKVDVREVMKKAERSLELLWELRLFAATDCIGEIRTRKPAI